MKTLVIKATDTLFFRESRPMESMGELQSVFPPSIRTLAGAIRSLIGEMSNVNWHEYESNENHLLRQVMGFSENLGNLNLQGAWLAWNGERLYPAPLHLMIKDEKLFSLELAKDTTWCDLGSHVRLPKLPDGDKYNGGKPLENTWLTHKGLEAVLKNNTPTREQIKTAKDLFERESRLGIARDNNTRTVQKGMLYQTQHIRPKTEVSIELDIKGLPKDIPQKTIIRLGGEGRTASVQIKSCAHTLPKTVATTKGLLLYLLTPLPTQLTGKAWHPLPNFTREERGNQTVWVGTLNGIELELHGAVTGKSLREGGWDMAKHQPRPVTSLIPAGSVFFCTVKDGNTAAAIKALHNQHIQEIGADLTAYGYGHLAVGIWND
ncbi:MAG: hypothetical protein RI964_989 [Pseudomonadota bacterium]|jgi:CRISPR-associated protein Cmr3